jgi:hypothetical protein
MLTRGRHLSWTILGYGVPKPTTGSSRHRFRICRRTCLRRSRTARGMQISSKTQILHMLTRCALRQHNRKRSAEESSATGISSITISMTVTRTALTRGRDVARIGALAWRYIPQWIRRHLSMTTAESLGILTMLAFTEKIRPSKVYQLSRQTFFEKRLSSCAARRAVSTAKCATNVRSI